MSSVIWLSAFLSLASVTWNVKYFNLINIIISYNNLKIQKFNKIKLCEELGFCIQTTNMILSLTGPNSEFAYPIIKSISRFLSTNET